jgi:hypothetical protein
MQKSFLMCHNGDSGQICAAMGNLNCSGINDGDIDADAANSTHQPGICAAGIATYAGCARLGREIGRVCNREGMVDGNDEHSADTSWVRTF